MPCLPHVIDDHPRAAPIGADWRPAMPLLMTSVPAATQDRYKMLQIIPATVRHPPIVPSLYCDVGIPPQRWERFGKRIETTPAPPVSPLRPHCPPPCRAGRDRRTVGRVNAQKGAGDVEGLGWHYRAHRKAPSVKAPAARAGALVYLPKATWHRVFTQCHAFAL